MVHLSLAIGNWLFGFDQDYCLRDDRLKKGFTTVLGWQRDESFGMKPFFPRAPLDRSPAAPGLSGVCGLPLPGAGMAFAGVPRFGPPAIPLRRARLASGRLCRRLSGGRLLDAAILHHADPARGIPARHDLPAVGSGIRAGSRFFRAAWITRTSLRAVAKTACL